MQAPGAATNFEAGRNHGAPPGAPPPRVSNDAIERYA
jgi:hypothetical protein